MNLRNEELLKKGGVGGGNTVTGLKFEKQVNILTKIAKLPGYTVRDNNIYYRDIYLASCYPQHSLYSKFLQPKGINYLDYISKKYLPDEAIYVPGSNTLYIIEMKFQNGGGSVDEKPQTADFKRRVYMKLTTKLKLNVEYCLVLSEYFNNSKFDDVFAYIHDVGCNYFFNELPLYWLGFPEPHFTSELNLPEDDYKIT